MVQIIVSRLRDARGPRIARLLVASGCFYLLTGCTPGESPDEFSELPSATAEAAVEIHQGYSETAPLYEVDGNVVSNTDIEARLWNPRGKTPEQIQQRADFLLAAYNLKRTPEQQARAQQARDKYQDAITVNSVMIGAAGVAGHEAEHFAKGIAHNRDSGITLVSVTAYAYPSDGTSHVLERLEESRPIVEELGMIMVTGIDDILQTVEDWMDENRPL